MIYTCLILGVSKFMIRKWMLRSLKLRIMLNAHPKNDTLEVCLLFWNCFCTDLIGFTGTLVCFFLFFWGFLKKIMFVGFCAEILLSTSVLRPRADVAYCLHALARRLAKTHNWTVWLSGLVCHFQNLVVFLSM